MIINFLPSEDKPKTRDMTFADLVPGDLFVWDDCLFIAITVTLRADGEYLYAIDMQDGTPLTNADIQSDDPVSLVSRTKSFDIREDELIDIVYIGAE